MSKVLNFFQKKQTNQIDKKVFFSSDGIPLEFSNTMIAECSDLQKQHDYFLDCTKMLCPRPLFEISKKIKNELESGQILLVSCKDPAFKADIIAWTNRMNCDLELEQINELCLAYIQKKQL